MRKLLKKASFAKLNARAFSNVDTGNCLVHLPRVGWQLRSGCWPHFFLPGKDDQTVAFIFSLCIAAKFRFHDFEVLPVRLVERVTANR